MTILNLLGLDAVKPYTNNKAVPLSCADPSLLMGLELEIEGIPVDPSDFYVPGMYGEEDGSLRNNEYGRGWEFITRPATFSVTALVLDNFFKKAKLTQERNYSERCSVHVHANVQDLLPDQLKSVCLLYQVFERMFYTFAGDDRDKSIFCVPWSETTLTHKLIDSLMDQNLKSLHTWQKYTGLNLAPVQTQGTIEFRHLPGTCDLPRILDWMNLIGCLFATARNTPFEEIKSFITEVNTTSEYRHLVRKVFGEWERVLNTPQMESQLEDGVLDVKYMLAASSNTSAKKAAPAMVDFLANRPRFEHAQPPEFIDDIENHPNEAHAMMQALAAEAARRNQQLQDQLNRAAAHAARPAPVNPFRVNIDAAPVGWGARPPIRRR